MTWIKASFKEELGDGLIGSLTHLRPNCYDSCLYPVTASFFAKDWRRLTRMEIFELSGMQGGLESTDSLNITCIRKEGKKKFGSIKTHHTTLIDKLKELCTQPH